MLRVEIPDELLVRAVSDAVERQLTRINDFAGYVDLKGACKFLSVGETQFKEWVRHGLIHARKVSTHLVRFRIDELRDFMEQFKIERTQAKLPLRVGPSPSTVSVQTTP
ncbi:MAG: helix-turn-helix domain-containing protein [Chthoniobacteraceae bacterium]